MFEALDRQTKLTANQWKIISAAIIGNMLDFFDYFLIGFVLAFIIGPWNLTYGQSAMVLLSSGVGAVAGGFFWGYFADRFGRRPAFIATVLCFSFATGALAAIQVLGHWYETSAGERVDGVGLLDVTTAPQEVRTIGEVASTPLIDGLTQPLTGFENHRGGTVLGPQARPLAAVTKGAGNRLGDGIDGAVQGSVVATYLHGCCLARNPELADHLLSRVVGPLEPLNLEEVDRLRRERLAAPRRV